jgi:hypothetical protein
MRHDPKGRVVAEWDTVWDAQFKADLLRLAERWECTWMEAFLELLVDFQEQCPTPEDGRLAGTTTVSLRPGILDSVRDNEVGH